MKKSLKTSILFGTLLIIFSNCIGQEEIQDCGENGSTLQVLFTPLDEIENYSENCFFGKYPDEPTYWVIQTKEEFDIWKNSLNCVAKDLISSVDFESYTLLLGFINHPDSGIEFKNQELLKSCTNQTYTYTVNFTDLPSGFTVLTSKNYGLLTKKIPDNYLIEFEINITE